LPQKLLKTGHLFIAATRISTIFRCRYAPSRARLCEGEQRLLSIRDWISTGTAFPGKQDRSRPRDGSIHGKRGISSEGSLPLGGITPSKGLNIQLSKSTLQAVGLWRHSHLNSRAFAVVRVFQNRLLAKFARRAGSRLPEGPGLASESLDADTSRLRVLRNRFEAQPESNYNVRHNLTIYDSDLIITS